MEKSGGKGMKPPIISDGELRGFRIVLSRLDAIKSACTLQRNADLKWFIEWGKEICNHTTNPIQQKRLCRACWEELIKE